MPNPAVTPYAMRPIYTTLARLQDDKIVEDADKNRFAAPLKLTFITAKNNFLHRNAMVWG